ncbi:hypothetical protein PTKIN_Ptkin16aG0513800 [Pterospermum kingtungense]
MDISSGEDSDISESEMEEYEDKSYEKLKNRNHSIEVSGETYTCSYCPKKKKNNYLYKELPQHASGVENSNSAKRSIREKANHLALVKYLEKDLAGSSKPAKPAAQEDSLSGCDHDEKIVWPWRGVVVNAHTRRSEDGRSGLLLLNSVKTGQGYIMPWSFEKAYEADHHGKKDGGAKNGVKCGLYAWVACAADYKSSSLIRENLHKTSDLKTITEIMEEEARKQEKLVSNLTNIIETETKHIREMEERCSEASKSLEDLMEEKENLLQAYDEEIKKIQLSARERFQRISNDRERLKLELEKREALNENERKRFAMELEENAFQNSALQLMTGPSIIQRQKEELHKNNPTGETIRSKTRFRTGN